MRVIGAADDDLKVLIAKRFLLPFESGVVVIKHWLIHNLIQGDRYRPTRFQDEKSRLFIKENKSYTDNPDSVNRMLTQVRLGKDRLNKGKEKPTSSIQFLKTLPLDVIAYFSEKYKISTKGVVSKTTDLVLYCEAKGRVYKNYKSFLENAIRADQIKLRNEYPLPTAPKELEKDTPELIAKRADIAKKMRDLSNSKRV
jgi:hypothetical protein